MSTQDWCPTPETPFQKDACSTQSTIDLSYLCSQGWHPLLITGFFRDLLIRQWANATNIKFPEMKRYVWKEDVSTGILIESVHRFRADLVEKRPAIMIKRNSFRNVPVGFAGESIGSGINAYQNEKGAITQHTTFFAGSHTLFCIHGTGASTELLASEVLQHIVECMPPIRRQLGLRQFSVTEVGNIQQLEESDENYVVPITVGWAYQHTWELKLQSLPLQAVSISGLLGLDSKVGLGTSYQGP
jgi:hypothetical protein